MALLGRLVGQIYADEEVVVMLGKQIVVDYQQQKAFKLVTRLCCTFSTICILSQFQMQMIPLRILVLFMKNFSWQWPNTCWILFQPQISHSADFLGLGVVWSLILGRPNNRQACLSKALKVANKLYQLDYISGEIEQFATNMLLSADDRHAAGAEFLHSGSADERGEMEVRSGYTSTTGSQFQEPRVSGIDSMTAESTTNSASVVSFAEAQRLISLVFSLCTKKPSLLQFLFDVYGRAPKTVKQVFHRHIPIVIRALGQSCSQLLQIISDPPQGSENLLTLVLQILTQETIPSPDLVATVKYLYETKLKDATILIPILSSLSKNEVLPIFPRRVDLPLEKFQLALAHILQGSAHIGPALTPAKALVAIHDIIPEKGGLPHKKITDACSACFEQRTVFTQQVLAKALNQMVDQIPLPLLFMRTVIQAIDAFSYHG
ncbi:hypothetical protein V6Z11_A05G229400 [Gossypium hirsutum]